MDYVLPALGQTSEPTITAIEKWQREILYGFTSRELDQLDCLPTRELKAVSLRNSILPILRRENWEKAPAQPDLTRDHLYPLQNGRGMWSADNDVVWNVMEPIVRLASRMLTSIHVTPWVILCHSVVLDKELIAFSLMPYLMANEDLSRITDYIPQTRMKETFNLFTRKDSLKDHHSPDRETSYLKHCVPLLECNTDS